MKHEQFKDTYMGMTHHEKDACIRCMVCDCHLGIVDQPTLPACNNCLPKVLKEWDIEIKEQQP